MDFAYLTLSVTIALAFVGYFAKYANDLALARRRERLELVSRQLNEFYGPLYLSSRASAIAYETFRKKLGIVTKGGLARDASGHTPTMKEWRIWVTEVLMPLHLIQEASILKSAHLIREQEVPDCLLTFVAHVAAWKAVLRKWGAGEYSELLPLVPYPSEVSEYASLAFRELKAEQLQLIGRNR